LGEDDNMFALEFELWGFLRNFEALPGDPLDPLSVFGLEVGRTPASKFLLRLMDSGSRKPTWLFDLP
jgi:hypothetical protein